MKRRRPRRSRPALARLAFPLLLGGALALCLVGFVRLTAIALYRQQYGPPGAEHPWDWYAEGCLALAILLLAGVFLTRAEAAPTRWLGRRARDARAWRLARPAPQTRPRNSAKRTRRSGYNRGT